MPTVPCLHPAGVRSGTPPEVPAPPAVEYCTTCGAILGVGGCIPSREAAHLFRGCSHPEASVVMVTVAGGTISYCQVCRTIMSVGAVV